MINVPVALPTTACSPAGAAVRTGSGIHPSKPRIRRKAALPAGGQMSARVPPSYDVCWSMDKKAKTKLGGGDQLFSRRHASEEWKSDGKQEPVGFVSLEGFSEPMMPSLSRAALPPHPRHFQEWHEWPAIRRGPLRFLGSRVAAAVSLSSAQGYVATLPLRSILTQHAT
jgi:hypothetical protein